MNDLLDVHGASVWEWMKTNCGTGADVEKLNHVQAQKLERQAKEGMAESQYLWGLVLWYGWGVPEDEEESNGWMMKAAEAGHPLAELTMGVNHLCGHASPRSEETARHWLKRAAAHGNQLAAKMLEDLRS